MHAMHGQHFYITQLITRSSTDSEAFMSNTLSDQNKRLVRLNTVLGDMVLIPESVSLQDRMSHGFLGTVHCFSETEHALQPKALVGTPATFVIVQTDGSLKYFNGVIQRLSGKGSRRAGQQSLYDLEIVSWLQLFGQQRQDCRIFQDQRIEDVIHAIFSAYGRNARYQIDLSEDHPARSFWVQYNETDYDFLKRICAREALAFYFSHKNGEHCLHITDSGYSKALFPQVSVPIRSTDIAEEGFTHWHKQAAFVAGKHTLMTYNYKRPAENLRVSRIIDGPLADFKHTKETESYTFTEDYESTDDGKKAVEWAQRRSAQSGIVAFGQGNCRHLSVGQHFSLRLQDESANFPDKGQIFTVASQHLIADDTHDQLTVKVEAIAQGDAIYPTAHQPQIGGLQTGTVTGPSGEEVYTDGYGRVKVHFHWDRESNRNENSSCWLRVMQNFAGPNFGAHFTPRIGQEVVIAFENGNPERPFVLGALYHTEHLPPYSAQRGTRMGIRSQTLNAQSPTRANELYFEDSPNQEEVYLQAEKALNVVVKDSETRNIHNSQSVHIKQNMTESVGQNKEVNAQTITLTAGTKLTLKVGGSVIEMSGSAITISSSSVSIKGSSVTLN